MATSEFDEERAEALVEELFGAAIGFMEISCAYLGTRLGLYDVLATTPVSAPQLAERAGIDARYAREWLEQQTTAGVLDVDDAGKPADDRTYSLPAAHAEVLANVDSLFSFVGGTLFAGAFGPVLPELVDAYRTGAGVPLSHYGADFRDGQGLFNRPSFRQLLAADWIQNGAPDVHERLSRPGARVLDLGSGIGWSSIALAAAYPDAHVLGIDLDEPSIADARRNAADAGAAGNLHFEARDAADLEEGGYDVAFILEALHDMSDPVGVLAAVRRALAGDGVLVVMDERVADSFGDATGDPVERFMYAVSVLHCLPASRAETPSAATGTVIREDTVRAYAAEAGFATTEVLPIENDFFRFYRIAG